MLGPGPLVAVSRGASSSGARRRLLLALVLSFGTRWWVFGVRPYELIMEHVPGFRLLRSPYRFAAFVQLLLLVFAGLGLDRLRGVVARPRLGSALVVGVTLLAMLEVLPWGKRLAPFPSAALEAPFIGTCAVSPTGPL